MKLNIVIRVVRRQYLFGPLLSTAIVNILYFLKFFFLTQKDDDIVLLLNTEAIYFRYMMNETQDRNL